ncbi:MAG TPA: class I SAM-dependent methyltransferase [Anaerolineaceae bacterium]|nr:class I SAM-dependent methyltransferase [Anaerolineaceae bacterium]
MNHKHPDKSKPELKPEPGHFRLLAPFYERFIQPKEPEKILAHLGLPQPGGAVLDAGGGTGRVAQYFIGKAAQVVVADQTYEMLLEVRKKDGLAGACSLTEEMPFADEQFCCIVMVDALHHVSDQAATIRELWRLLKPGGRIIIEEPDIRRFSVKLMALAEKLALMRSHFLSPQRIISHFNFGGASSKIEVDGWTAWIIIEKALT